MAGVPLPSAARGIFGAAKKSTQINVPPAEAPPVEVQSPPAADPVDTGEPPSDEPAAVVGVGAPTTPIAGAAPPPPPPEEDPVEIDLAEPEPPPAPTDPLAAIEAKKRGAQETADRLADLRAERQSYLKSRGATKTGYETGFYEGQPVGLAGLSVDPKGRGMQIAYERAEDDEGSSFFLPGGKSTEEIEAGLRNIKKKQEPVVAKIGELDDEIRRIKENVDALAGVLGSAGGFSRRSDGVSAMQGATRFDLDLPGGVSRLVDETQGDFYRSGKPGRMFTIEDMTTPEQKIMFQTYAEEQELLDGRKVNVISRDRLNEIMQDHNKLNRMLAEKMARRGMFERRRADLDAAHKNLGGMLRKTQPQSKLEQ